jgi:hypothetical protein
MAVVGPCDDDVRGGGSAGGLDEQFDPLPVRDPADVERGRGIRRDPEPRPRLQRIR